MTRGIRWDAEYVTFMLLGVVLGLLGGIGCYTLWAVSLIAQNLLAG